MNRLVLGTKTKTIDLLGNEPAMAIQEVCRIATMCREAIDNSVLSPDIAECTEALAKIVAIMVATHSGYLNAVDPMLVNQAYRAMRMLDANFPSE